MKILCVVTGGTFGSHISEKGVGICGTFNDVTLKKIAYEHFSDSVIIDFIEPIYKLSENIDDKDWNIINDEIMKVISNYDSILVVHGTDTMAYTASALSYNEQISKKMPIVFTGANLPLSFEHSDAIVNFTQSIYALINFTNKDITGVFIVFNGSTNFNTKSLIHLGVRVKKVKWEKTCYRSFYINSEYLGQVSKEEFTFDMEKYNKFFNKKIMHKKTSNIPLKYNANLVSSFKIYPGFDPHILKREFDYGKRYFIIEIYSSGTAPMKDTYLSLSKSLDYIDKNNGIVFAISQQEGKNGATMDIYESSKMLRKLNIIGLQDMTWEASIVKLMYASSFSSKSEIIEYMLKNISAEILCLDKFAKNSLHKENIETK